MSLVEFTKSQGLGNDFIVIADLDDVVDLSSAAIRALCDRHFGIGADGLILVQSSSSADYFMNYYNADGSIAKMCGNGIRVFAKYVYDHIEPRTVMSVETRAGIRGVELALERSKVVSVAVDMGPPELTPARIPVDTELERFVDEVLAIDGTEYRLTAVSMGNPHAVTFVDEVATAPVKTRGPLLEESSIFPDKVNVEFVEVKGEDHLKVRVWERGVGETLACGTGACAALVAAHLNGRSGRSARVELPGGVLLIEWLSKGTIRMSGPAEEVFTGQIDPERLVWNKEK